MKASRQVVIAAVLAAMAAPAFTPADGNREQEAQGLIQRAIAVSNLRSSDTIPFRMMARFKTKNITGRMIEGSYELVWISPEKWRERISVPTGGYERVRVGAVGRFWQSRTTKSEVEPIHTLTESWDFIGALRKAQVLDSGKPRKRTVRGQQASCVKVGRKGETPYEMCFDIHRGVLLRIQSSGGYGLTTRTEFDDFLTWQGRLFPRAHRQFFRTEMVIEIVVEKIEELESIDPSLFDPPPDSREWGNCADPQPPVLLEEGKNSPELVRRQGPIDRDMMAAVYAVIGTDGKLRDVTLARSARPDLDAVCLEYVRGCLYRPQLCDGIPVETERIFKFGYYVLRR
jgi:hypothetical protein